MKRAKTIGFRSFLILIKDNPKPCLPAMPKAGKPVGWVDSMLESA